MLSISCVRAAHTFQESLSFSPGIYFFPSEQAQPSVLVSELPEGRQNLKSVVFLIVWYMNYLLLSEQKPKYTSQDAII